MIKLLFRPVEIENTVYTKGGGSYTNLFDAHPPFQIDGNFGAPAGMIEMLIQSQLGTIDILPALPDALPNGKISGVCAVAVSSWLLNGKTANFRNYRYYQKPDKNVI